MNDVAATLHVDLKRVRLIDADEVTSVTSLPRSTLYRAMKHSNFPKPIQLVGRRVAWSLPEVMEWIHSRPRGTRNQKGD